VRRVEGQAVKPLSFRSWSALVETEDGRGALEAIREADRAHRMFMRERLRLTMSDAMKYGTGAIRVSYGSEIDEMTLKIASVRPHILLFGSSLTPPRRAS
jgi:hypothetical protein